MGGLVLMLTTLPGGSSKLQEQTILQTEARAALNRMEMEIRGAFTGDGVSADRCGGSQLRSRSTRRTSRDDGRRKTQSSFHLQKISYQVTSTGLLQRQFMASTNTFPSASCLTCGGTTQWAWPGGGMSAWTTVAGSTGAVVNASNSCTPANSHTVPGVFCYYQNDDVVKTIRIRRRRRAGRQLDPQAFTGSPLAIANTSALNTVVVTLDLSSGGSQPVEFVVSDAMTIRGTS